MVQRVEVVVDRFHLGALGHVEAKAHEHILDFPPGPGHQVQAADLGARIGGERDVDAVSEQALVELGGGQLAAS